MHRSFLVVVTVLSLSLAPWSAMSTDIVNEDNQPYQVTVMTDDGPKILDVAPTSELQGVCAGCEISMEDGQVIEADSEETVGIVNGELSILK